MVETFTMNDVLLVDWDFLKVRGWYFSIGLRFSHGIKIIPSQLRFLSGCSRFSRGWEVNFFLKEVQFILEGYILKLVFSHDKALPCILQEALNFFFF